MSRVVDDFPRWRLSLTLEHAEFVLPVEHPGGEIHLWVESFLKVTRAQQSQAWVLELDREHRLLIYKIKVTLAILSLKSLTEQMCKQGLLKKNCCVFELRITDQKTQGHKIPTLKGLGNLSLLFSPVSMKMTSLLISSNFY